MILLPGKGFGGGLLRVLALVYAAAALSLNASAAPALAEYEVKAAFILNFTKFVEWPPSAFASADAPLTICILGEDPFGRVFDQIVEGESVNGHKIVVARLPVEQQKTCHVIYAAVSPATQPSSSSPVLTIGEGDEFLRRGGMIAFVLDNRHVRFDINLKAATNAGLRLSSKLLSVARSVER
jgi:hypothetical protein